MPKLSLSDFTNFFKYYSEKPHQKEAIELLYKELDTSLFNNQLYDDADWVQAYRKTSATEASPSWPITKAQLAEIMLCSESELPDYLMDDFAKCVELYDLNSINIGYFLGQCGHESAGLRYPVEIHSGKNYEWRRDLGNVYAGDGELYAGTGWLQNTGRYNHQRFSDHLQKKGEYDPKIMELGKTYSGEKYPWTISGFWWYDNNMINFCNTMPDVDEVGARVNGRYLPNGYQDRRDYTSRAFRVLGL